MKVFIGFSEVANFVYTYRQGFEAIGHKTFTVVTNRNKYYPNAEYDYVLSEIKVLKLFSYGFLGKVGKSFISRTSAALIFFKALKSCDVFYYNTGGNLLPFRIDYFLLKLFRKKIIVIFLGSEIRHWYLYQKELEVIGFDKLFAECIEIYKNQNYGSYFEKIERVKSAEKYADLILSQPGYAQLQTKPYKRATVGLLLPSFTCKIHNRRVPLIVHIPSSRGIKGTEYIIEALDRLKKEGIAFDFRFVENLPNPELVKLLEESDIVIDELNSDTIGVLSTEAMATGNAVLTSYFADFAKVPLPCPVINTNKKTIYENVKKLIIDINLRNELANQGRIYVERYHDITKIVQTEINWLNEIPEKRKYDFTPSLHISKMIPPEIIETEKSSSRKGPKDILNLFLRLFNPSTLNVFYFPI